MNKQQEIEKMAKKMQRLAGATALINAGYGDVRAVVEDVAERIKTGIFCELADDLTFKMAGRIEKIIKEVLNEHKL